ncbi:hypothetical protein [Burkholderia pseudomallei]|uniref:hypothetical protein n=1 Tax=Burkholderia pseudomallei TaxID=28450 RepID=UPI000F1540D6|nr:hypothetical protein [Burkholderia pseudomallei]CAJ3073641.1 Uncharacterised protein [Burkholderia pseudomallei]VCK72782.1 Uncharacterised protein [Burkholderia pseudomallei]VCK79981.1 Uncharacterised protein [Burkholderia pseudomallei]VCK80032.1 Uncharacterised protein [Burkholderia pseudomallei]VCK80756.1 Uncharacterised protein [Burkholderia pseudomallei]
MSSFNRPPFPPSSSMAADPRPTVSGSPSTSSDSEGFNIYDEMLAFSDPDYDAEPAAPSTDPEFAHEAAPAPVDARPNVALAPEAAPMMDATKPLPAIEPEPLTPSAHAVPQGALGADGETSLQAPFGVQEPLGVQETVHEDELDQPQPRVMRPDATAAAPAAQSDFAREESEGERQGPPDTAPAEHPSAAMEQTQRDPMGQVRALAVELERAQSVLADFRDQATRRLARKPLPGDGAPGARPDRVASLRALGPAEQRAATENWLIAERPNPADPLLRYVEALALSHESHRVGIEGTARIGDALVQDVANTGQRVLEGLADVGESTIRGMAEERARIGRQVDGLVKLATALVDAVDQAKLDLDAGMHNAVDGTNVAIVQMADAEIKKLHAHMGTLANDVVQLTATEFAKMIDTSFDPISATLAKIETFLKRFEAASSELEAMKDQQITLGKIELMKSKEEREKELDARLERNKKEMGAAAVGYANDFSVLVAAKTQQRFEEHVASMRRQMREIGEVSLQLRNSALWACGGVAGLMCLAKVLFFLH